MIPTNPGSEESRDYNDPDYWRFTIGEFTCGFCAELAITLHMRYGWPLHAEWAADGGLYHAWVVNDAGRAVDINGVHSGAHARTFYDPDTHVGVTSLGTLDSLGLNAEGLAWAEEILRARPALIATTFDWEASGYAAQARRVGAPSPRAAALPATTLMRGGASDPSP